VQELEDKVDSSIEGDLWLYEFSRPSLGAQNPQAHFGASDLALSRESVLAECPSRDVARIAVRDHLIEHMAIQLVSFSDVSQTTATLRARAKNLASSEESVDVVRLG